MGGGGGAKGASPTKAGEDATTDLGSPVSGGLGLVAQPAGMYVVKDDEVRWVPAIDVNRMVRGFTFVAIVLLLVVGSIARAQARNR